MKKPRTPKSNRKAAVLARTSPRRGAETSAKAIELPPIPKHPKITQARIDAVLAAVREGSALYLACRAEGVTEDTWENGCKDAPWLASDTTRARECSSDRDVQVVREASEGLGIYAGLPCDERRLIADNRKWTAGRKAPKRWGDRIDVTSAGEPILAGADARGAAAALLAQAAELRARIAEGG